MTKPQYNIIFDFDDVIYPFCQGIMAVLAEEGITGNITQWALENDFGIDRETFWEMVYQPKHNEALFMQPITLTTLAQMRRLRYAGHRLHIVTARSGETAEQFAMDVIRRDNVPLDSITFTKDKAPMVDELDATFSVDDGPHNYTAFHLDDHVPYLMDAPHNQHVTEHVTGRRVSDITDFTNTVIAFQQAGVQLRGAA